MIRKTAARLMLALAVIGLCSGVASATPFRYVLTGVLKYEQGIELPGYDGAGIELNLNFLNFTQVGPDPHNDGTRTIYWESNPVASYLRVGMSTTGEFEGQFVNFYHYDPPSDDQTVFSVQKNQAIWVFYLGFPSSANAVTPPSYEGVVPNGAFLTFNTDTTPVQDTSLYTIESAVVVRVPEPSTLALLGLGAICLVSRLGRRPRRARR